MTTQSFAGRPTDPLTEGMCIKTADGTAERYLTLADLKTALVPRVEVITQTILASAFTDGGGGGGTIGTLTMSSSVPAGAIIYGTKVTVGTGFTGATNNSATLQIGDGSDVDRLNTGTPSIYTTAATGVQTGPPSGDLLVLTAFAPVLTVTVQTDFTTTRAGAGSITVRIYYLRTA